MTRFVVDCETLLRIGAGEFEVAPEHQLVAPTLVRSQALAALYAAARRGEITTAEGLERVTRINSLKVRFLGDKVLQRTAWRVADELGWETTAGAPLCVVASSKLPPVIVAVGVQERQSGVCWTSAFQAPGSEPEALPANFPSVDVNAYS